MLGDENKPIRDIAVDKIMSLGETLTAGHTDIFKESSCEEVKVMRKFKVPFINKNATSYYQLCRHLAKPIISTFALFEKIKF